MDPNNGDDTTSHEEGRGSPRAVVYDGSGDLISSSINERKTATVRKQTSWHEELTTEIIEIPRVEEEMMTSLFYNKQDFQKFQQDEQRRYDKKMMKQIQGMIRDIMADQLAEATESGATPEELEAMMPQTTEEIFAMLGSLPAASMPLPPKALPKEETLRPHHSVVEESLVVKPQVDETMPSEEVNPLQQQEEDLEESKETESTEHRPEHYEDYSDDAIYDMLGIEEESKQEDSLKPTKEESPKQNNKKDNVEHRPEHYTDFSDDDIYQMLGVDDEEEPQKEDEESTKAEPSEQKDEEEVKKDDADDAGHRPEHYKDYSDDDIYQILAIDGNEPTDTKPTENEEEDVAPTKNDAQIDKDEGKSLEAKIENSSEANDYEVFESENSSSSLVMDEESKDSQTDHINEVLGTSISTEVHVEVTLPASPRAARGLYKHDDMTSSDEDEPLVSSDEEGEATGKAIPLETSDNPRLTRGPEEPEMQTVDQTKFNDANAKFDEASSGLTSESKRASVKN
jgi:hypothetical protein